MDDHPNKVHAIFKNSNYLAKMLAERGISLQEVRVIPDVHCIIKGVVNNESSLKDYVFTSGGIGPTHDDITAEAVASSFDVPLIVRDEAVELLAFDDRIILNKTELVTEEAELKNIESIIIIF